MSGKKKAQKAGSNLGRSIIKQQFPSHAGEATARDLLETERGKHKLRSVTQCDDLEELMSQAALAGTDFTAKRGEMILVGSEARTELERVRAPEEMVVGIPRRPPWQPGQTREDLDANERASFLEWRRTMADIEENQGYLLTPFEKNLEVWRQLWRVLERAQLVVQIVDARNPLLFRCAELDQYVTDIDPTKRSLLLVNKADLLSEEQRAQWADYLRCQGIDFIFWSAAAAQAELEEDARREKAGVAQQRLPRSQSAKATGSELSARPGQGSATRGEGSAAVKEAPVPVRPEAAAGVGSKEEMREDEKETEQSADEDEDEDEDEDAMLLRLAGAHTAARAAPRPPLQAEADQLVSGTDDSTDDEGEDEAPALAGLRGDGSGSLPTARHSATHVHTRDELLDMLIELCPAGGVGPDGEPRLTVGLVGYPNVGKSSTVNVLVAAKKTSVSATPGKTKHFQTLWVPDVESMLLCDCPGLVFPTVAGSKAQMVCDGVLPVDQLKDYMPPMRLLCERLSVTDFEQTYAIRLRTAEERMDDPDAPEIAREVLMAHALARGFMTTTKGTPDESRSARIILKDVVNAKLLYVEPPPGMERLAAVPVATELARKVPQAPTTARWLDRMKADYEAQEGTTMHSSTGSKGKKARDRAKSGNAVRAMQWRPTGTNALPDRLVAQGPRVETVDLM